MPLSEKFSTFKDYLKVVDYLERKYNMISSK